MSKSATSAQSQSYDSDSDVINLRQKLSSMAWVQCDITSCMKWRRVEKEVAVKLTSDTWWECSMNVDHRFNTCNTPEEDIESFDKLARRAKLAVFKSELTPGSLVWAKTVGYCNWPALVTRDPANDSYCEEDEDEPDKGYYHVEYLGKRRCHGWVFTRCVELFGEGNIALASEKDRNPDNASKDQEEKNTRKRKRSKALYNKQPKKKKNYCGGTVHNAIEEAMRLLPLSPEQRLKTCNFVKVGDVSKIKSKVFEVKLTKGSIGGKRAKMLTDHTSKIKCRRSKRLCSESSSHESENTQTVNLKKFCLEPDVDADSFNSSQRRKELCTFDFMTSLFDVTKEERLILDIEVYKEKEISFYETLENFFSQFDLSSPTTPVWQDIKVNLFDYFLAVHERGGFNEVSSTGQWSAVFFELTNYPSKGGGAKAKAFYKRYLYPYELYIKGDDFLMAMKDLDKLLKPSKYTIKQKPKKPDLSDEEDSDLDNAELKMALDELDDLLQSLKGKGDVVPDWYKNDDVIQRCDGEVLAHWNSCTDREKKAIFNPTTGSQNGPAVEPEECAQVVPEMDFPSFSGSSPPSEGDRQDGVEENRNLPPLLNLRDLEENGDDWVLQELQALEQNL